VVQRIIEDICQHKLVYKFYVSQYNLPSPFEDSWAPKKHQKNLQDAPFSMVWFGDFLGISWIATPSENGCHSLTFLRGFSEILVGIAIYVHLVDFMVYIPIYIYHKNQPNVGKYTIHGSYGISCWNAAPRTYHQQRLILQDIKGQFLKEHLLNEESGCW